MLFLFVVTFLNLECDYDLLRLMRKHVRFNMEEIKCIMYQIFDGLRYLHDMNVFHRDIKGFRNGFGSPVQMETF